jgi:phage baseplate assembly protein W
MLDRVQYKINTLDLDVNKGIGIALPFNPVNIFTTTYTTKDQVRSNLLNFMLTNSGERYFNPEFGADLRNMVFDNMSNLEEKRSLIADKIRNYFPEIVVEDLIFEPNFDKNFLYIRLFYSLNNQQDNISIQIT